MRKTGLLRIESDDPQTVLAAYFEATGFSKSDFAAKLNTDSRTVLYRAINGEGCSPNYANELHELTDLAREPLIYGTKQLVWTLRLLPNGRAQIWDEDRYKETFAAHE